MKNGFFAFGRVLLLVVVAVLALTGCEVLEESLEEDSQSRDQRYEQPPAQQPQPVLVGYNATLEITQFTCLDGEEDDFVTSSGEDEITLLYSIVQTDQNGWAVRASNHGWGPYDIHAGERYDSRYFKELTLSEIPLGYGLVVPLSIVEIEDYSEAQDTMDTINEYASYVEFANMFNPEPYSRSAIEITGKVLYYAGIGLDIVDWADDDDVLADNVDVGNPNLVHSTLASGGQLYNGWNFSGENNLDHFEYEISYVVHLQPIYR